MKQRKGWRHFAAIALASVLGLPLLADLQAADTVSRTSQAASGPNNGFRAGRATGFPVPRFVSLKSASAHMRVGPSTDYPTAWVYNARGLPLEITDEYGNWRRVRDQDGASGWMFAPLLSGRRTAVVGPWLDKPAALHADASRNARVIAMLDARVRLDVERCDGHWCQVALQNRSIRGMIEQALLWGIYPEEVVE